MVISPPVNLTYKNLSRTFMLMRKETTTMAIPNSDADANQPLDGSVKKIGAAGAA